MEPCKHEQEWGQINEVIKGLVKQIYGNGQKGMAFTIPMMQSDIQDMTFQMAELKTAVSGVLKFVNESEGYKKGVTEAKQTNFTAWQKTSMAIAAIAGIVMIVFKVIESIPTT